VFGDDRVFLYTGAVDDIGDAFLFVFGDDRVFLYTGAVDDIGDAANT